MPNSSEFASALAAEAIEIAAHLGLRIATAESLTGGMLASEIVSVPGASRAFSGGVVAYDTELKATVLGVNPAQLELTGPVDSEVAQQMASGVRRACAAPAGAPAALGISTTGVAGPASDPQTGQPAGTVWIGVSSPLGERSELLELSGLQRAEVREGAVLAALRLLRDELEALRNSEKAENVTKLE